jgi:hypothetical protein
MKALRRVYEFVTGGSVVTPIGLIAAMLVTYFCVTHDAGRGAGVAFLVVLALTFLGSAFEIAR